MIGCIRSPQSTSIVIICRRTAAGASSSFTPYKPNKTDSDLQPAKGWNIGGRIKSAIIKSRQKPGGFFGGRSPAPLNYNYPNKKGDEAAEVYITLEEAKDQIPGYLRDNFKKAAQEIKDSMGHDKAEFLDAQIGPVHNQVDIHYDFKTPDQLKRWQTGCDSDWGEGFSKLSLIRTEHGTALFSGYLDTRLIQDGRIERAGWATMKSIDYGAFNRRLYLRHWNNYTHLLVKCRGDGRSYKLMLHTPDAVDLSWLDSHSYPLHTHGGPYWQYERIPFSKFFHTVGGRIQDKQARAPTWHVSNIGIVLMDRIDGKFQLEIDYIGVVNDRTHEEKFAYETYSLPIYTPDGF